MKVLVSIKNYSKKHNLSRQSVYTQIKKGKLQSIRIDNKTYIVENQTTYNHVKLKKAFLSLQRGLQEGLHDTPQTLINKGEKVYNTLDNEVYNGVYSEQKKKNCKSKYLVYIFGLLLVVSLYANYYLYQYLMSL